MANRDPILDFYNAWCYWDRNNSTDTAQLGDPARVWKPRFESAGYPCVYIGAPWNYNSLNAWLRQNVGEQNYVWMGAVIWFYHDADAALCSIIVQGEQ